MVSKSRTESHIARLLVLGTLSLALCGTAFAQQHQHAAAASGTKAGSEDEFSTGKVGSASTSTAARAAVPEKDDDNAIFCPTMKTGQLCSHGTASVLQVDSGKRDEWIALAKKYNKAVDTATVQLFKDAEGVLTPEQIAQLKAWFAVGLNPQINELLYSKGLGPVKK